MSNGYRRGAELGVSKGRFTSFLCATFAEMHMTAVDLWAPQQMRDIPFAEAYADWNHDESFDTFSKHCETHFPGRVEIMRMRTEEAAIYVPDGSLDFVFVDADHTYGGCKTDIELWLPKVRKNGMICGHDYDWPTVAEAVRDTIGDVFIGSDNVWIKML